MKKKSSGSHVSLALLAALAGCGGEVTGAAPCVPGQSTPCACADGRQGAQQCLVDGTYGQCSCTGGLQHGDAGTTGGAPDASAPPPPQPQPDASAPDPEPCTYGCEQLCAGVPVPDPWPTSCGELPKCTCPDVGCPHYGCDEICAGEPRPQPWPHNCPLPKCACPERCEEFNVVHATSQIICDQTVGALAVACNVFGCQWSGPSSCTVGGSASNATAPGAQGQCCCGAGASCSGKAFDVADGTGQDSCNRTIAAWSQICGRFGCAWNGATQCTIGGSASNPAFFGAEGVCM